jgi:hypothetical protein
VIAVQSTMGNSKPKVRYFILEGRKGFGLLQMIIRNTTELTSRRSLMEVKVVPLAGCDLTRSFGRAIGVESPMLLGLEHRPAYSMLDSLLVVTPA